MIIEIIWTNVRKVNEAIAVYLNCQKIEIKTDVKKLNARYVGQEKEFFMALFATYSRQKLSGLSWMVKRYYIQDYPENFRGNTETRTIASDFIRPSIKSSLTRREKKTHIS